MLQTVMQTESHNTQSVYSTYCQLNQTDSAVGREA